MENKPKLCEIIAVEKGVKGEALRSATELHRLSGKPQLFEGQNRTFEPKEDADHLPAESVRVQQNVKTMLDKFAESVGELINVEATKDHGNLRAKSNVEVDGVTVLEDVPTTFLLALEKELERINTFVKELPQLDPAEEWEYDSATRLHRASSRKTQKTKKTQKPVVLYDATEEHPAQTQLITEDVVVGFWNTQRLSGAISADKKQSILVQISKLRKAVKTARERANSTEVVRYNHVGQKVFDFLFD
jgi:hypothetical protein